jgi:hypothetical protein
VDTIAFRQVEKSDAVADMIIHMVQILPAGIFLDIFMLAHPSSNLLLVKASQDFECLELELELFCEYQQFSSLTPQAPFSIAISRSNRHNNVNHSS